MRTINRGARAVSAVHHSTLAVLAAPRRVTLDTNPDDCNFSCTMCEQHSVFSDKQAARIAAGIRKRRMDPLIFESVLEQLAPLGLQEVIPSTMGEPLMYAHFERLVEAVRARGVKLNLTTNGSFYPGSSGHTLQSWASLLLPILSDVKISWNGASAATQERIMRGSKWDTQINNLKEWVKARDALAASGGNRASVTLQLTFMASNLNEIPAIIRLGIASGVDRIKGHHLWAHFKEIKDHDLRSTPALISAWNNCVHLSRAAAEAEALPNGSHIKLEHFEMLPEPGEALVAATETACPFLGKEAWVNYAGDFAPCCAPDEQRKSLGNFGNVRQPGGIMGIWASPAYRELLATYKSKPLCATCQMRK